MDVVSLLRTLGALGLVLGVLAGALWAVRRYDISLPGRVGTSRHRRIELVERFSLDAKRSIALIRRDGSEHLILLGPEGHVVIETAIATEAARPLALAESKGLTAVNSGSIGDRFSTLVERANGRQKRPETGPQRRVNRRCLSGVAGRAERRVVAGA